MAKGKKRSHFFLILLISYIILLVSRLALNNFIGSVGTAFFSVPNEIFFLIAYAVSFGLQESTAMMIENRMNRHMYRNARTVFSGAFVLSIAISVLLVVLAFVLKKPIVNGLFKVPHANMSYIIMIPAVPFMIVSGVFRGHFEGTANKSVNNQSYIVFAGAYLIFTLLFSYIFSKYGAKVSDILRVEDFKYSYSAAGASIGILTASVITFLHMSVSYILYQRRTVYEENRDYTKNNETLFQSVLSVFINGLLPFAVMEIVCLTTVVGQIIILGFDSESINVMFLAGEYYSKIFPIIVITMMSIALFTYPFIKKSIQSIAKEEYRNAREKFSRMIHRCSTLGFYFAALFMVLGDNILKLLFEGTPQSTVSYFQIASLMIITGLFAISFSEILISMRYTNLVAIVSGVAFVVFTVLSSLLSKIGSINLYGVIIGMILFGLIITVISFLMLAKIFQYTQEWFRSFAVSIIGSLISALVGLIINKFVSPLSGLLVSMLISIFAASIVYIIILLLLKGYTEEELEEGILGRFMLAFGHTFHLI